MTHPYQRQVDKMWDMIKRKNHAQANGFWLESISLSYILIEIELRLLLSSKAGESGIPVPPKTIDTQKYLIDLAKLAKKEGFINEHIYQQIKDFNEARIKAIHGLAKGDIDYEELKEPALSTSNLIYEIQSRWLPIKFGEIEHRPDS